MRWVGEKGNKGTGGRVRMLMIWISVWVWGTKPAGDLTRSKLPIDAIFNLCICPVMFSYNTSTSGVGIWRFQLNWATPCLYPSLPSMHVPSLHSTTRFQFPHSPHLPFHSFIAFHSSLFPFTYIIFVNELLLVLISRVLNNEKFWYF